MGRSIPKTPRTVSKTPEQWKDPIPHKYCGKLGMGNAKTGKPNKVHRCNDCLVIKARQSKSQHGTKDIKLGRQQKMSWQNGEGPGTLEGPQEEEEEEKK